MRTISVSLSTEGITKAIKDIQSYQRWVETKSKQLCERLAAVGVQEASVRFSGAMYSGVNDAKVTAEPIYNGWRIVASGEAICFIEFGTGVFYNPSEPYPEPRPAGISSIGEYGKGKGKQQGWVYEGEPGTGGKDIGEGKVFTRGNPAQMPMWYAKQEIVNRVTQIAQEVFM